MTQEDIRSSLSWKDLPAELRRLNWWPLLLAPAAILAVSIPYALGDMRVLGLQNSLDDFAPFLIGFAAAVYIVRSFVTRNPLYILLAVLVTAMTIREIHFEKTPAEPYIQKGIYIAAALVGVWGVLWRKRLIGPLAGDRRHWSWLTCTFAMYFISVVVSRRVFRFVPGERMMHRVLEEALETVAHAMFMVTCLLGNWRRAARSGSESSPAEPLDRDR